MAVVELTCRELVELVTDYLEDALSAREHARFEQHLDLCAHCRDHLEQLRATVALAGRLREADLSPDAGTALLAAFRVWRRSPG
jgi:anti-sigma factor RsiW